MKWHALRGREAGFGAVRAPGGRKTGFGAVLAGPLAAKRVLVQSALHRHRQAPGLPAYFVVKTTERPIEPRHFGARTAKTGNPGPDRPQSLHRNPFGCQMGCGRCAETRPAAIKPAETAPSLARLPSARQSQAPRNSFGNMAFCLAPAKAALGSNLTLLGAFTRGEGRNGTLNAKRLLLFRATALCDAMEPAIGFEPMTPALRERCSTD